MSILVIVGRRLTKQLLRLHANMDAKCTQNKTVIRLLAVIVDITDLPMGPCQLQASLHERRHLNHLYQALITSIQLVLMKLFALFVGKVQRQL